ncbi:MAG: hypothetical protein AB7O73_08600 [Bacteroidia bacterium]
MLDRAKYLFVGFFILLLAFSIGKYSLFTSYLHFKKIEFRQLTISNNTSKKTLTIPLENLFVNESGFEWENNNKELVIDGIYHEVLSITKFDNKAHITIIEDKAENELFHRFFASSQTAKSSLYHFAGWILFGYLESHPLQFSEFIPAEINIHLKKLTCSLSTGFTQNFIKPPISANN